MAFYPTSNPPCKYCGSTRTAKAVYSRSTVSGLVVTVCCENPAACKVRAAKITKGA